jgi:hypothetical protein
MYLLYWESSACVADLFRGNILILILILILTKAKKKCFALG